jgi:hypothetical protein
MSNVYNDNSIFPVDPGCPIRPLVKIEVNAVDGQDVQKLKEQRSYALVSAERAAYNYAKELDTGPKRIAAFEVYEKIRTVLRCE